MSQAIKTINVPVAAPELTAPRWGITNYLPALVPLAGAFALLAVRKAGGPGATPTDGTLIVWALLAYIFAAAALLTNFWAPVPFLQRLGLWAGSFGFFANFGSWLVRWVTSGERENWIRMTNQITGEYHIWWFFSYIPYANLYDLSIAFSFGAAFGTLLWANRPNTRFVGAVSFPLITLILLMAIFIGNSFIDLPPVLDSYWRPIHVGVASLSYGVALVSFALAVLYLIKDGVKIEAMAATVVAALLGGYVWVWLQGGVKAFDPLHFTYSLNPVVLQGGHAINSGARVAVPGVGLLHGLSLLLLLGMAVCFLLYLYKQSEAGRKWGHRLLRAALGVQAVTLGVLFYQMKSMGVVGSLIGENQYYQMGRHLLDKQAVGQSVENIVAVGANFLAQNRAALVLDVKGNPVEFAALFTMLVITLFIVLFGIRTEKIRAALPPIEKLDNMVYKTVGVAFAGLAILLVTGAVWANESWGRYWGWDAKETGALVAWLSYAGYLHTRIAHGWTGRRSAYFALVGFLLVIFTYLGVSYILPGLHSYAG
jgi:cytochrome c-type biogenesis protein CcsB